MTLEVFDVKHTNLFNNICRPFTNEFLEDLDLLQRAIKNSSNATTIPPWNTSRRNDKSASESPPLVHPSFLRWSRQIMKDVKGNLYYTKRKILSGFRPKESNDFA